jgi:PTH1 family peptidyl-tRNA hydrolase
VHIIVGLGNPGRRYRGTRHNLGFDVIDVLACRYAIAVQQRESQSLCGKGRIGKHAVLLVEPQTFMNRSGLGVAPLVRRYLDRDDRLVVIHDDIDLPLGRLRIKHRGGDAGHRGVRSIIECLGAGEFTRIRMGIGRPSSHEDIVDYVLTSFPAEEREARDAMIVQAADCVESLLTSSNHLDSASL